MDSRIFFAAVIESVITVMSWMSSISMAGMRPVQIAISLALRGVTLIELICSSFVTTSDQM